MCICDDTTHRGVRTLAVPVTECPSPIDMHEVKRDLKESTDAYHNCLTQSSVGPRALTLRD